jgi:hypothetical protein
MEFSRSARARINTPRAPSPSKLNSVRIANVEIDIVPGEPVSRTATGLRPALPSNGTGACRSKELRHP